ncbi:hypothetical protein MNNICLKF_00668 [Synechococcus sp. CBW1107]|nr:hypothetical protein MNNICLKF_00668 [Synechococcus sp. CBW1107]
MWAQECDPNAINERISRRDFWRHAQHGPLPWATQRVAPCSLLSRPGLDLCRESCLGIDFWDRLCSAVSRQKCRLSSIKLVWITLENFVKTTRLQDHEIGRHLTNFCKTLDESLNPLCLLVQQRGPTNPCSCGQGQCPEKPGVVQRVWTSQERLQKLASAGCVPAVDTGTHGKTGVNALGLDEHMGRMPTGAWRSLRHRIDERLHVKRHWQMRG